MKPFDLLSNAVRAKEIFAVLARHGFGGLLNQIDLPSGVWQRLVPSSRQKRSTWERVRLACEELGPTFVKFGQLLSMRPDAIPHGLIIELQKLQNAVAPLPFAEMRAVLLEEFDDDPSEYFSEFSETPIASASLAQVYFAKLKDGREVAVKIQRPGIEKPMSADLDLITWVVGQLHARIDALRPYDLPAVVDEVKEGILRELDFSNEARNQQFFNAQNPHPEQVFAPAVVNELTTRRVLVMERIIGHTITKANVTPEQGRILAAHGASSLIRQVLITGFFHADPHGGNVIVTADGRLCLLDWGLVGHLTKRLRHALADLFIAAARQEPERIVEIASSLGPPSGRADLREMERDVTLALRDELNYAIGREQLGRVMLKLLFIFGRNGIHVTRDYSLMAKAVLSIEDVGRTLDPEFEVRDHAAPILRELARERTGPKATLRNVRSFLQSTFAGIQDLPGELYRIIRRIERDDLTINLQHKGLDDLDDALKTAANRITLGVIIGSLIVGSSLIVTTRIPPYLFGYPTLGIIGYVLSAILGLYVVWDIFIHGRHR